MDIVLGHLLANQYAQIRIFDNESNRGVGFTRNRGIELATGEYIIFLDADDEISNIDLLLNLNNYINKYNAQYVMLTRDYYNKTLKPNYSLIKGQLQFIEDDLYRIIDPRAVAIQGNFPFGGSASSVLSIELIRHHRFDVEEQQYEDWLFFLEVYLRTDTYYYKKESIKINYDENSLSRRPRQESIPELPKVYLFLKKEEDNNIIRKTFFWMWANSIVKVGMNYITIMGIVRKHRAEFIRNVSFRRRHLKNMIKIMIKLLHSYKSFIIATRKVNHSMKKEER